MLLGYWRILAGFSRGSLGGYVGRTRLKVTRYLRNSNGDRNVLNGYSEGTHGNSAGAQGGTQLRGRIRGGLCCTQGSARSGYASSTHGYFGVRGCTLGVLLAPPHTPIHTHACITTCVCARSCL